MDYAIFILGELDVDRSLQSVVRNWNQGDYYFEISIPPPEVIIFENSPPSIDNMIAKIFLAPGVNKTVDIGEPFDVQLDEFYVSDWGYTTELSQEPNWIFFVNETISEGLVFDFRPNMSDYGTELSMYIELTDLNQDDPKSAQYKFTVEVSDLFGFYREEEA